MTVCNDRRLRIGAVSYLNSKPLIEGLTDFLPDAELLLEYPSRLADNLAAGLIDVALIPTVECFGEPGYQIVSDACVASRGPVLSVKLYSRVPVAEIRRLALDEGSRTSAMLVRVLLAERFGIAPQREPLPLGSSVSDTNADAILLIGDRAIQPPSERFAETWDLGEEWTRQTDLPFVFAVWAARPETDVTALEPAFRQARDLGVQRLRDIARREAAAVGIEEAAAYDYLSRNLCFRMKPAEQRGLALFHELAVKQGLIAIENELVFSHDDSR
ncbi:MAG: menaquinone biosynthetic enzyme MqnA/MqnD family protein [Planctomycetaceae bacterium]